jgi:hypothetical protein
MRAQRRRYPDVLDVAGGLVDTVEVRDEAGDAT